MQYRIIPNTDMNISRISFGTIPILNGPHDILTKYYNLNNEQSKNLIRYGYECGINFFDTATNLEYADAENKLGIAIKEIRNHIYLASKARKFDKDGIIKAVKNSLKTLCTDYLDVFFIHQISRNNVDIALNDEYGALAGLKKMKQEGYIKYIGFATHHKSIYNRAIKIKDFDICQIPINIMENGFTNSIETSRKIGVLGMKIFGGGVLSKSGIDSKHIIGYGLKHPFLDSVLIGFGKKSHIDEAIKTERDKNYLSTNYDYNRILSRALRGKIENVVCNRCQLCSCVNEVDIDKILRYRTYYYLGYKQWAKKQYNRVSINKLCLGCKECELQCPLEVPISKLIKETKDILTLK